MHPQRLTVEDYAAVVATLGDFWGERDLRALHHPMFVHEFGDTALAVRADGGGVGAYLLGFVAPGGVGYVHLVGVRADHRRRGLGRMLYTEFARLARARGATALKAITSPANADSIAFHRALGMTATIVPDYAGPGADRVVFSARLGRGR